MSLFFKSISTKGKESITIKYHENSKIFNLVLAKAQFLSKHNLGPNIINYSDTENTITYERVNVLSSANIYSLDPNKCIESINLLINILHNLGYGHGDLHIRNIGYKDEKFYLLDPDTLFKIDEPDEIVKFWLIKAFDDDINTIEDLLKYDYEGWRTDWLCEYIKKV